MPSQQLLKLEAGSAPQTHAPLKNGLFSQDAGGSWLGAALRVVGLGGGGTAAATPQTNAQNGDDPGDYPTGQVGSGDPSEEDSMLDKTKAAVTGHHKPTSDGLVIPDRVAGSPNVGANAQEHRFSTKAGDQPPNNQDAAAAQESTMDKARCDGEAFSSSPVFTLFSYSAFLLLFVG